MKRREPMSIVFKVLLPFALAHLLSYLYRTVNAVVYPELASDLGLAPNSIGLLTSAYFLMFALAQLPVGVALDRYGPRKVQIPMLIVASLGALLFAYANSIISLVIARGLIGLGVAACLMSAIKGSSLWFSSDKLPLITATLLSVGGIGAMISTTPMHIAMEHIGWRDAFLVLGGVTLFVSLMIFLVVPEHSSHKKVSATSISSMTSEVKLLFSLWSFWRLALYSLVAHAAYMSIQGLWMGPWLTDVAKLDPANVAYILLLGTVAMFAGSLIFGWITDRLIKFSIAPILVCGTGICIFVFFQLLMIVDIGINPVIVAVGFSFFGTSTTMNYAIVAQSVDSRLTGRVSTSFNLIVFLLAFVLQWGFGEVINLWKGIDGVYPTIAYQYAIGVVILLQIPGLLLWFSFKPWKSK